jgi:amidohydrolase
MDAKQSVRNGFDEIEGELLEISRALYEHPETAREEHESSALLAGFLERHGLAVERPAHGLDTAFSARIGTTGPEVVICAEYDALPGVGHACGHNIIAAAAVGTGVALARVADELGFRVTVLGTPAEEKYGGKVELIEAGAFDGAAVAMMVHPSPADVVDPNVIAIAEIDVHFRGKTSHASAYPHRGINALDAFVQGYVNVSTLRQALLPTDKVHGIITHGGEAPNVIPDYTRSSWYVRAQTRQRLDELLPRVTACFEAAAVATGCELEVEPIGRPYDELVSNPVLIELFSANARELGRSMSRGADMPPGQAGSTDMGNVSRLVPSLHPMLGINSLPAVNHQAEFAAHTVTPDGERAIRDGTLGMAWTIVDVAERRLWDSL